MDGRRCVSCLRESFSALHRRLQYVQVRYSLCSTQGTQVPDKEAQTLGVKSYPSAIKPALEHSPTILLPTTQPCRIGPSVISSLRFSPLVAPLHPLRSPKADVASKYMPFRHPRPSRNRPSCRSVQSERLGLAGSPDTLWVVSRKWSKRPF
jgi:hypothetical protein